MLDENDFHRVYEEQADFVFNLSRRLAKTKNDAEDLFQESFLKAYRFFPKFRGGSIRGWLRKIVVTTNISAHRGLKNKPLVALEDHEGWKDALVDPSAGPEELTQQREKQQVLQRALGELSEEARTVIVLREVEGLNYEEISQVLDVPKGTVRSRLARAREALRQILEKQDG